MDSEALARINFSSRVEIKDLWAKKLPKISFPCLSLGNLRKAIAYELQTKKSGSLSRKAEQSLRAYYNPAGAKAVPPASLQAGATLIREWNGRRYVVDVVEGGFQLDGRTYRSLSQIAKTITGTHWSGPRFFGLVKAPAS